MIALAIVFAIALVLGLVMIVGLIRAAAYLDEVGPPEEEWSCGGTTDG